MLFYFTGNVDSISEIMLVLRLLKMTQSFVQLNSQGALFRWRVVK